MALATTKLGVALGGLLLAGVAAAAAIAAAAPDEKVIAVSAMKFEFLPETINLKKGEPVILELSSLDRTHGFKVPALGLRADVLADTTVRVRVMEGVIVVSE